MILDLCKISSGRADLIKILHKSRIIVIKSWFQNSLGACRPGGFKHLAGPFFSQSNLCVSPRKFPFTKSEKFKNIPFVPVNFTLRKSTRSVTKVERVLREIKKEKTEEPEVEAVPPPKKRKSARPKKVTPPAEVLEKEAAAEKAKESKTKNSKKATKNKSAKEPAKVVEKAPRKRKEKKTTEKDSDFTLYLCWLKSVGT